MSYRNTTPKWSTCLRCGLTIRNHWREKTAHDTWHSRNLKEEDDR